MQINEPQYVQNNHTNNAVWIEYWRTARENTASSQCFGMELLNVSVFQAGAHNTTPGEIAD
jgi:hypothetical protein